MKVKQVGFHTNFVDLNPNYSNAKRERMLKNVEKKMDSLGKTLIQKVYDQKRTIFSKDVKEGKRLNYGELRDLDSNFRKDYMEAILAVDNKIQKYATMTL